ncbi:prohead assembly (scaffolding) protein [Synechococcus phage BUCT-ZZ01]|nr:prohead assembly (scaffolding) protein [Synechococcus phage BUCT-ZZ01]
MKFITEIYQEPMQILQEEKEGKKELFIEGIFAQAETKNRNGRVYPKKVMEAAINKYIAEYVQRNRAVGEMNHPPRLNVDFERATHMITEMKWYGNNVYGKAKVLKTPMGKVLEGLLESGVAVGVSTRGAGSVKESNGASMVGDDFVLTAVDVVADPSGPECWVDSLMENKEWVYVDGRFVEKDIEDSKKMIQEAKAHELNEVKFKAFMEFMNKIKI